MLTKPVTRKPSSIWLACVVATGLTLAPAIAHADAPATSGAASTASGDDSKDAFPERAIYLGVFGGGIIGLRQWDLGRNALDDRVYAEAGWLLGVRGGYQVLSRLGIELSASFNRLGANAADDTNMFNFNIGALYHLTGAKWAPFVSAGAGITRAQDGGLGSDTDPVGFVGFGVRGLIAPRIALRLEARDMISDGFDNLGSHNLELTIGVDFFGAEVKKVSDRDKDGIADEKDACPDQYGSATTGGCPDRDNDGVADANDKCPDKSGKPELGGCPDSDGDGIADNEDKCPNKPGKKETGGCPDSDGDGIADNVDKCPDKPGKKEMGGCPDSDGDGIADGDDKCPNKAGVKEFGGCPDRDKDGVADAQDQCPDQPGKKALNGCPDGDNDGVPDKDDKCPKVTGLKSHQGCLPVAVKRFTGSIKGIRFLLGKATIRRQSYRVLNQAVKVLKNFPDLRIRIEGHTDSRGGEDYNQKLSENRANSVRAYLLSKGIAEDRIQTKGYGESKPIADNKTRKGRAANRRIEFIVLGTP